MKKEKKKRLRNTILKTLRKQFVEDINFRYLPYGV